jgi:hypothetical protein
VTGETEFCLLGPLMVRRRGVIVPVPAGKQQVLLAAAIGSLDNTTQQTFAEDPSPAVRANLASRARELDGNVLAVLQADEHLDVKRALAAALPSDRAAPNT